MRLDPVTIGLQRLLDDVSPIADGALADYIPQLAQADPDRFGIALVSMDGHAYGVGDDDVAFTIQSISKPFVYALALGDLGLEPLMERVGVEPSGEAFNAIRLEPETGRPPNPLVNAGALLTTSLVEAADAQARFARIHALLSAFAGRELEVDDAVYRGERATASRNRAIAYLMQSAGSLRADVEETIDVYCRQCAVSVTARDLAVMAATLANRGVNPFTGATVVDEPVAVQTLSVMATRGMYDFSGEWLLRIGLPAKSGVAGGLIAASPAEFGIGVFSPRLDRHGNTVRGIAVARELADRFHLHLMHRPGHAAPVVYDSASEPVQEERRIAVLAVQGDLDFRAVERLLWRLDEELDGSDGADEPAAGVVLDLHRVTNVRLIAERALGATFAYVEGEGIPIVVVDRDGVGDVLPASARFRTRAEALAWLRSPAGISPARI
jgi:glutaminase